MRVYLFFVQTKMCACSFIEELPLAPMWVLSPMSAYERHSQPRIKSNRHCLCTCLQSHLQSSPSTPQQSVSKFRNPRTSFENTLICPPKSCIVRRGRGGPESFFGCGSFGTLGQFLKLSLFFLPKNCIVGGSSKLVFSGNLSICYFQNCRTTPFNGGHFVLPAMSKGCARTTIRPK
jgi:hypothetical protein